MSSEPVLTQHKVTVLLIDDQPMIGEAVRRMIASEPDIDFHYCRDATLALEEAHRIQPTVILQDLVMPEIDGLTMVKTFRADERTREIPIILLLTKEEPGVKADAFELGANDIIVKLPDRLELLARIRYHSKSYINLVELARAHRVRNIIQTQSQRFQVKTGKESSRPLMVFLCHSSGDKPFVRDLYKRLLNDGINPWLDEVELPVGCEWELEISKAVRETDLVIVCLSIGAVNEAGFIQKEIKTALDVAELQPQGEIFVIPLKMDDKCIIPERLRRWQWVNYFDGSGHEKLLHGLETRVKTLNQRRADLGY